MVEWTHVETSTSLIEGISNDALLLFTSVIAVVIVIVVWQKMWSQNQVIHPNSMEHVQATRERVLTNRNSEERHSTAERSVDDRCPICIDQFRFAVETNCGHLFCASCLLSYWEHGNWIAAMNCPVCRQEVKVILTGFTHEEDVSNEVADLRSKIQQYNRRFSGEPRTIWESIMDFPVLARHMFRSFFSVSGLVVMLRVRIVLYLLLVLIYILSPFDIIPEAVTGLLGFLDDFAIAAVIILYLTILFRQSLAN